ncbi:MAG: hypothetical protein E7444_00215 [Ruminococcaceae bacterium]|nr:hypothetical protein [Oscillospiraceae bacterium]
MKKLIVLILALVMIVGVAACGYDTPEVTTTSEPKELAWSRIMEIAKQGAINACCREEGDSSIKGFEAATIERIGADERSVKVSVKGNWYKLDEYGKGLGFYYFEYSCNIQKFSGEISDVNFRCWK